MLRKLAYLGTILVVVIIITFGVVLISSGAVAVALIQEYSYRWDKADLHPVETSFIYNAYGDVIAELHGSQKRIFISGEQIPEKVKQAFIAVEDKRFYQHKGLDYQGISRAILRNLQTGAIEEGASTITQQLARNAFLTHEKTWERKFREAIIARELEKALDKEQILEYYLNYIYFGHGTYGVEAASRMFFGKSVTELDLEEIALLAAVPANPSQYSPYYSDEKAKIRRNEILTKMFQQQFITPEETSEAQNQPIRVKPPSISRYQHPYYVDYVILEAIKRLNISEEELFLGGYHIYTTLEEALQRKAESLMLRSDLFPPSGGQEQVQGAIVLLDHTDGRVLALVGGRGYEVKRGFNRAIQMRRQPGSTFKPIAVFAPALELGYDKDFQLKDQPINIKGYRPKNYGDRYFGKISMEKALTLSANSYAVQLLERIGVDKARKFSFNLGILLTEKDQGLALALGGLHRGVTPLELTAAYGAFANGGNYLEPFSIMAVLDSRGKPLLLEQLKTSTVMSIGVANDITTILERVVQQGTATRAQLAGVKVAGKTGTTPKDAWFVGYTPELVATVWMGFDNPDSLHQLKGVTGGSYPAVLWRELMSGD